MFRAIAGLARDESIAITGGSFFFLVHLFLDGRHCHSIGHCHFRSHMSIFPCKNIFLAKSFYAMAA